MEAKGLEPNPEQAAHRLLRRIYFDLTGLPPGAKEVQDFVGSPRAGPSQGDQWGARQAVQVSGLRRRAGEALA